MYTGSTLKNPEHKPEYAEAITTEIQQALEELNSNSETEEAADDAEETDVEKKLNFVVTSSCMLKLWRQSSQRTEAALGLVREMYHELKSSHEKY